MKLPFSRTIKQLPKLLRGYTRNLGNEMMESSFKGWSLSPVRRLMYFDVCGDSKYYLPQSVEDKVVLDVGAGEGETAKFYLENGAKMVIAVECDPICWSRLEWNSRHHSITTVAEPFCLQHLLFTHDFAKIDIEGYEELLLYLNPNTLKPTVVEVHGLQLADKFEETGWKRMPKDYFYGGERMPRMSTSFVYMYNYLDGPLVYRNSREKKAE